MIWNYLNLKNKGRENKANRASSPYRDAVHPGSRSEDVRHNEECRFFLHNNNLQSRGKTHKVSKSLSHSCKETQVYNSWQPDPSKMCKEGKKMAQWVKVPTTKPDRTHMRKRRNKSHKWSSDFCMLAMKAYTINILKFLSFYLYCVHICILYMYKCLPRSEERGRQWML